MKVIEVTRHGAPDVLQLVEKPTPTPSTGEILIEVKAVGINFADLMSREGSYPVAPPPPFVPGFEVAGLVSAVGEGVSFPAVGTRVTAMVQNGGYAEYAIAEAARAVPLPENIAFAPATALLVQGLTAYFLLEQAAKIAPGQSVMVSGAAGGVGSLLVQIAKKMGVGTVVGLASTEDKRKLVTDLGADIGVDYTAQGWADQVKAATEGRGVDFYFDATGDFEGEAWGALASGGKWVLYGRQEGDKPLPGSLLTNLIFQNTGIVGFSLYSVPGEKMAQALPKLLTWASSGELRILSNDSFPLSDAAQAHTAIAARKTTGKVVLIP